MINSRAARLLVAALITTIALGGSHRSALAQDDENALSARLIGLDPKPSNDVVFIDGQTVQIPINTYKSSKSNSEPPRALTLYPPSVPNLLGEEFRAVDFQLSGITGADAAVWLVANSPTVSTPLTPEDREIVAVQIALWSLTGGLTLDSVTVRDQEILARSLVLAREAKAADPPGRQAVSWSATAFDVGGSLSNEKFQLGLRSDGFQDTFLSNQALDLRVGDAFATICTGERALIDTQSDYLLENGNPRIPVEILEGRTDLSRRVERNCAEEGVGEPFGLAEVEVPRTSDRQKVEVEWNVCLDEGVLLLPTSNGTPVVTIDDNFCEPRRTSFVVEAASIADLTLVVQEYLTASLLPNNALGATLMLLLLLVIISFFVNIVTMIGRAILLAWRKVRGGRRNQPKKTSSDTSANAGDAETQNLPAENARSSLRDETEMPSAKH